MHAGRLIVSAGTRPVPRSGSTSMRRPSIVGLPTIDTAIRGRRADRFASVTLAPRAEVKVGGMSQRSRLVSLLALAIASPALAQAPPDRTAPPPPAGGQPTPPPATGSDTQT